MQKEVELKTVTIIFYSDHSLELLSETKTFVVSPRGRVIIPDDFKQGKSILAVCAGKINILNKVGERILPLGEVA